MSRRPSTSELFAWSLLGAAVGLVAGVGLALSGWADPRAQAAAGPRSRSTPTEPVSLRGGAARRAVAEALGADGALRDLTLEVIPAGPGRVELHGWVPSRGVRSRAGTVAGGVAGITTVVNALLVEGEDRISPALASEAASLPPPADRPA